MLSKRERGDRVATQTTNLGLIKPAGTDYVLVSDFNSNADTLDGAIGDLDALQTTEKGSLVGAINDTLDSVSTTVNVGTTITGAAGTNASVTNSGTNKDAVFNFTIPQGASGTIDISTLTNITGLLRGNGATIEPATAGTHYLAPVSTPTAGHLLTTNSAGVPTDSGMFIGANNNAWYTGRDLKAKYGTAAAFMTALRTGAPFDIRIGDYWPITLSGTFRDVGSYTCPSGTTYYSDTGLTTSVGSTGQAYEATYVAATYCSIRISSTTYYVSTAACLAYFVRTLSNAVLNLEVAGINLYYNHGDTALAVPHILFCPRDCLPLYIKMRKTDAIWHSEATTNPWLGSAMYATLNDATYGLLPLIAATDIGAYIYAGPNSAGMRTLLPDMATGVSTPTGWAWRDRGKLFLPMEKEVWGSAIWASQANHQALSVQWPIFIGTLQHIVKGLGNAGSRAHWWCAAATGAASFARVSGAGLPGDAGASDAFGVAPCFLVA